MLAMVWTSKSFETRGDAAMIPIGDCFGLLLRGAERRKKHTCYLYGFYSLVGPKPTKQRCSSGHEESRRQPQLLQHKMLNRSWSSIILEIRGVLEKEEETIIPRSASLFEYHQKMRGGKTSMLQRRGDLSSVWVGLEKMRVFRKWRMRGEDQFFSSTLWIWLLEHIMRG